jgi:hypothetical protein
MKTFRAGKSPYMWRCAVLRREADSTAAPPSPESSYTLQTNTLQLNFTFSWLYISIYETRNEMHRLPPVYSVAIPLHVPGLLAAHRQDVPTYICDSWHMLCVNIPSMGLDTVKLSPIPSGPADSQPRCTTHTDCHIHALLPPDDGPLACQKHVAVQWLNKLKINSASRWFNDTHTTVLWNTLELPALWRTPHTARLESSTAPLLETQNFNRSGSGLNTKMLQLSDRVPARYVPYLTTIRHTQTIRHTNRLMCVSEERTIHMWSSGSQTLTKQNGRTAQFYTVMLTSLCIKRDRGNLCSTFHGKACLWSAKYGKLLNWWSRDSSTWQLSTLIQNDTFHPNQTIQLCLGSQNTKQKNTEMRSA